VPSHSAVFINEPRLSEFKQLVVSKGIQAEMSGGVLICNNVVAVRRVRCTAVPRLLYNANVKSLVPPYHLAWYGSGWDIGFSILWFDSWEFYLLKKSKEGKFI